MFFPECVSAEDGGEKAESSTCSSPSPGPYLGLGRGLGGPQGHRAALGPHCLFRKPQGGSVSAYGLFTQARTLWGCRHLTPALGTVALAKVSESSGKRLKGQESQRSRRRRDWNCGPHLTFGAGCISPLDTFFVVSERGLSSVSGLSQWKHSGQTPPSASSMSPLPTPRAGLKQLRPPQPTSRPLCPGKGHCVLVGRVGGSGRWP